MSEENKVMVSISTLTYNHAPFLRECLDGFMMQQCNFDFEVLIHDDASTDGSQEIIREYQKKYPHIIKPIFQTENQYSKGVRSINAKYNFSRAKGKYIAMCEGDDYWTDPLKLQKQVIFLECNAEYSLVVGGYKSVGNFEKEKVDLNQLIYENKNGFDITREMLFGKIWYTKTLTLLFRKNMLDIHLLTKYNYSRDLHLNYLLLSSGKGYYINDIFGVYRFHAGGVFSSQGQINRIIDNFNIFKELYEHNPAEKLFVKPYLDALRGLLIYNINPERKFQYIYKLFILTNNFKDLEINIKTLISHFIANR